MEGEIDSAELARAKTILARKPSDEELERIGQMLDREIAYHAERREHVFHAASRMVDALGGKAELVTPAPDQGARAGDWASAPHCMPGVRWEKAAPNTADDGATRYTIVGDLGDYYANQFPDDPSTAFNTGFYTAAIAMRLGLIDPEDFLHDGDPPGDYGGGTS